MVAAAEIRIANKPLTLYDYQRHGMLLIILEGKIQILCLPDRFLLKARCFVLLAASVSPDLPHLVLVIFCHLG